MVKKNHYFKLGLLLPVLFLSLCGIVFVFEASGKVALLIEQLIFVSCGFLLMFIVSQIDYVKYKKISVVFLFAAIVLLILVLVPGVGMKINGARRWINLQIFSFQPTEIVKLALVIFLAHWFENLEKKRSQAFLLLLSIVFILVMLEPDMGTALIIFFTSATLYFCSKTTEIKHVLFGMPFVILGLLIFARMSPYRWERVRAFLNLSTDRQVASYHVNQALLSVGSGGLWGVGIGRSKQKYLYLPESSTDSIFGIIAEETGFIGSLAVTLAYGIFFYFIFLIIKRVSDDFGKFLLLGIAACILFQAYFNISSMISLVPLTGVPLPFISSGGSAILMQFSMVGIMMNVLRHASLKKI